MAKVNTIILSIAGIMLFAVLLLMFVNQAGLDYGMDTTELNRFNLTGMNDTLSQAQEEATTLINDFNTGSWAEKLYSVSIAPIKAMFETIINFGYNGVILLLGLFGIIGIPPVVYGIIVFIIVISIVIGVIKIFMGAGE